MPSSVNAPGTPGYNPAWYSLANTGVYWDPANLSGTASDSNSGAASVSAVRSWNEIIRRFGSDSPLQTPGKNIIINKLSAQTLNVDPVFFFPRISDGGYAALIDTLVVFSAAAPCGTVTQINMTAGTDMTVASAPAGVTAGMYAFNSTSGSYAFVVSVASSVATMAQPITTAGVTTITIGNDTDLGTNWNTGDTVTWYNVPNLTNLKAWQPVGGDVSSASSCSVGWVQWTQIAESSGLGNSDYGAGSDSCQVVYSDCYTLANISAGNLGPFMSGCYIGGTVSSSGGQMNIFGGVVGNVTIYGAYLALSGNAIVQGTTNLQNGTIAQITTAHFEGAIYVQEGSAFRYGNFVWGAAGMSVGPMSVCENRNAGTWVNTFLLTGGMSFGGKGYGTTPIVYGTFQLNGTTAVNVAPGGTLGNFPANATISWSLFSVGSTPGTGAPYFSAATIASQFTVKSPTPGCNDTYTWQAQAVGVGIHPAALDLYGSLADMDYTFGAPGGGRYCSTT